MSINSFWNVYRQFVGRVFGGWRLAVCRWLLAVCRSVVAVGARDIIICTYMFVQKSFLKTSHYSKNICTFALSY